MTKYHINPETGRAGICRAVEKCRYGESTRHYDSKESAREDYERLMKHLETPAPIQREKTAGEYLMAPVLLKFRERLNKAKTVEERKRWQADYSRLSSFAQRVSAEEIDSKPFTAYRDYLKARWSTEKDWRKKVELHSMLQRMESLVVKRGE